MPAIAPNQKGNFEKKEKEKEKEKGKGKGKTRKQKKPRWYYFGWRSGL